MRHFPILSALLLTLVSCATPAESFSGQAGQRYYARYSMRLDRDVIRSTNYRGDTMTPVPINTEVEVLGRSRNNVMMRVPGGTEFRFEHVARHTQDTLDEAFATAFSTSPTSLDGTSAEDREAIERGEVEVGMTREVVLLAIGPPPAVGTLSPDSDVWKYWINRFVTFNVRFEDGKVVAIDR